MIFLASTLSKLYKMFKLTFHYAEKEVTNDGMTKLVISQLIFTLGMHTHSLSYFANIFLRCRKKIDYFYLRYFSVKKICKFLQRGLMHHKSVFLLLLVQSLSQ